MGNIIFSKISQDYGYESAGEQVKIELKVTRGVTPITITTYLAEGDTYTVKQIWQAVIASWNSYSWALPKPALTINHTNYLTTTLTSAFEIEFESIKIFVNENNPRSLELPMILGFSNYMLDSTGSIEISNSYNPYGDGFYGVMPLMGTWRMPLNIDNEYGFKSSISNWTPIKSRTSATTDITKKGVSNGPVMIVRGFKLEISNVPNKYLVSYDDFLEFSSRGEVELSFTFDIFGDNTYEAYIWGENSGDEEILFVQEQLMKYSIALIPSSYLEV